MEGKFTFRTTINGTFQKVTVGCTLELASWLVNQGMIIGGVFETITNRIYL